MSAKTLNTVLITGANSGIGLECAINIAKDKTKFVVITGRDKLRLEESVEKIKTISSNPSVVGFELDMSSLKNVENFVRQFNSSSFPPLYSIVCNAGTQLLNGLQYSKDGYEITFAVNHLAHFLLVNLMLPVVARNGRIIVVASGTHNPQSIDGKNSPPLYKTAQILAFPTKDEESKKLTGIRRYSTSKLCNVLFAYELARILELKNSDITVNSFDPGATPGTALLRNYPGFVQVLFKSRLIIFLLNLFFRLRLNTPENAGFELANLVLNPELNNTNGKYFEADKPVPSSQDSYRLDFAKDLWETSEKLCKLT